MQYAPSKFRSEDEEMSMVKEAFRVFDKDGSGYITMDEAKSILQRGENSISDEDLEEFFNKSDLDKDGQINYEGMNLHVVIPPNCDVLSFEIHVKNNLRHIYFLTISLS